MTTVTKIRKQILRRIERLPDEDLPMVDSCLKKLETRSTKKEKILAYAGAWDDMDKSIFREFTDELTTRRQKIKA
jgi:hypothetical protein